MTQVRISHNIFAQSCLAATLSLLSFLIFATPARAERLFIVPTDTAQYAPYPFIMFVEKDADSTVKALPDTVILDKAGAVIFKVNRFDVFTNDTLLSLLEREVIPLINRDSLKLKRMIVRGAASPEGPFRNNRMLGRERTRKLYEFMRERLAYPIDESVLATESVSEDYALLLAMMRRAGDPDVDRIQKMVNYHIPRYEYTRLKNRLMALDGGRLWKRLLREYFPQLRAARVVLFFENEPEPTKPIEPIQPRTDETNEPYTPIEPAEPIQPILVKQPRRELLSVKTNVLLDFAYVPGYDRWCPIPNIAVEFYPLHGHFTVGASFDCPWWQHYWDHKFFQIRNYQVEGRYYLRSGDILKNYPGEGAAFRGLYFSAYAHLGLFGICFDENRGWEGEGIGGGIGIGYVQQLDKKGHWRLEFSAQAGYLRCGYDPYQYENPVNPAFRDHLYYYKWTSKPSLFKERQYRFNWFGPTRIGITISYDILYRRWKKKGASFRPSETVIEMKSEK